MRGIKWAGSLMLVALAACGGGNKAAAPTAKTTTSSDKTADWKLGHFSSGDGMVRLVLDRTGAKPKVKMDDSKDIIELTPEEVRSRLNNLQGYMFVAPDGKRMIFVDEGGGLTFLRGRDELPMMRDGDATALGTPTISGAPPAKPPPEKSLADVEKERLTKLAVRTRFSQFKSEDSANPKKIAEAIDLSTADMWMHTATEQAWFGPVPYDNGQGVTMGGLGFDKEPKEGPATDAEKKGPLAKYNAWLRPDYEWGKAANDIVKGSWLHIYEFEFRRLLPTAPVLVWEIKDSDVVLVTADGGRYFSSVVEYDKPALVDGVPPKAQWPAPMRNNLMHKEGADELARLGLADKKTVDDLDTAYKNWGACAKKVFAGAQKEIEANLTGSSQFYAASNKNRLVLRKYDEKAKKECKEYGTVQDKLAQILAAREKERTATFERAKTKLDSLGLGK